MEHHWVIFRSENASTTCLVADFCRTSPIVNESVGGITHQIHGSAGVYDIALQVRLVTLGEGFLVDIPSGYVKIAIENGHRNSGFTH